MATRSAPPFPSSGADAPVRRIDPSALGSVLSEGWQDFLAKRGDLLVVGIIYPAVGLLAAGLFLGGSLIPYLFPVAAGIGLLGPLAAIGFYELARRREAGLEANWSHFLDVRKRPGFDGIMAIAGLLLAIFVAWLASAALLYAALIGSAPASLGEFLRTLFTTAEGWGVILIGNALGAAFGMLVIAVSVASLPMLVDKDVDARTALRTSFAAVQKNKGVMVRWGLIVTGLLILGSIPAFIGLAVVLPVLGYATWHLYTRLVDRGAVGG